MTDVELPGFEGPIRVHHNLLSRNQQKKNLQPKLKKHMAKGNFLWQRIREVQAVIDSGLKGTGLTENDKQRLCKQIRDTVKSKVGRLFVDKDNYLKDITQLKASEIALANSVAAKAKRTIEHTSSTI